MLDSPSLRWRPAAPLVGFKRQRTLDHYRTPNATPPTPVVDPARRTVVSVYDGDGSALAPWAERGYRCVSLAGFLQLRDTDLVDVAFACASPPSRDLSVAGARHWKRKREKDPHFQDKAVALVKEIRDVFEAWGCPYYISNPASSQLRKLWREPNYTYQPYDFGGWLDPTDKHPLYPDFIPAQDAYSQQQGLWTGGGFRMPAGKPVEPEWKYFTSARKGAGGTRRRRMSPVLYSNWSARGARASTPRGFACALCQRLTSSI